MYKFLFSLVDFIYYPKGCFYYYFKLIIVIKDIISFILSIIPPLIKVVIYLEFKLHKGSTYKVASYIYNINLKLF